MVVNLSIASHVFPSFSSHSAENIKLVRITFFFCNFCQIYVVKEYKKSLESTRDQFEKDKIHLGYCNRPRIFFCKVGKFLCLKNGRFS